MDFAKLNLPRPGMIIGGEHVEAADGSSIAIEDPSDGRVLGEVPGGGASDVDRAVRSARKAFESPGWSRMRPLDRAKLIERIASKIESELENLAYLESYDNGMPISHARGYIQNGADTFRYMSGWCCRLTGQTFPGAVDGHSYHAYTQSVPIGVVGAIVPWNGPFAMACWKVATALAAGCTIVLKPSELTPYTALRLAEIALEVGIPEGVVNVVTGTGEAAGRALVEHRGVDKIAFTGSSRVGRTIIESSARDFKRVTLELGGKSPNIVFDDADLDRMGPSAAMAIFANAGQACIAGSRLFIQKNIFDRALEAICKVATTLPVGCGREPGVEIGPLISSSQRHRVLGYIEQGLADGGEVVAGGRPATGPGYFVEPTVFVDVDRNATIAREEIFGPVLVATPFNEIDDVVEMANDTAYGLAGYVWTADLARAHSVANRIKAGSIWINSMYVIDPAIPFGGFKHSGLGRELSEEGIRAYTETRSVMAYVGG